MKESYRPANHYSKVLLQTELTQAILAFFKIIPDRAQIFIFYMYPGYLHAGKSDVQEIGYTLEIKLGHFEFADGRGLVPFGLIIYLASEKMRMGKKKISHVPFQRLSKIKHLADEL